jgi:uncharacterized protein
MKFSLRYWMREVLAPVVSTDGDSPYAVGLNAEPVRIPSARGLSLFGWFIPAFATTPETMDHPSPTVVLLHGWCGNASSLLPAALVLHHAGYAVLLLEARNHGRSDCDDHTSLPRFAEDLDNAIDWLKAVSSVDARRIAAIGHSVGAAAVLLSASRRNDLFAVVSVAAFAHPEQVMQRWFALRFIPYWPIAWLINRALEKIIGATFSDIAPIKTIATVSCPVLIIHGLQDTLVPVADAHEIRNYSNKQSTELVECDGTHEGFADTDRVSSRIVDFFNATMPPVCDAIA